MKKIGIFCLYSPIRHIDNATLHTLKELRSIVDCLIIVINGMLDKKGLLNEYADEILERENKGFDIGAYKSVILCSKYRDSIQNSNELILCNSSFFGPFIPLKNIVKDMENSNADFWGISSVEKNLVRHIQSYFIVFRKNILKEKALFYYLEKNVDADNLDYYDVCSVFENGLFSFLKKSGYQYDAYKRDISCDNYANPYGSVKIDKLPILKKKIFSDEFYDEERAVNALSYIKRGYNYNVNWILETAHDVYSVNLENKKFDTSANRDAYKDIIQKEDMVEREQVEKFIDSNDKILIYGNGKMAKHIFSVFFSFENKNKLEGFIVSDDQFLSETKFKGYPVCKISELKKGSDKAILVALNKENTKTVFPILKGYNVQTLWKIKQ